MSDDVERTSSQEFTDLVNEFFDDIAPNFKCSVCGNENFVAEFDDGNATTPVTYRVAMDQKGRSFRRVWLCVCAKCGNTYTFHKTMLDVWDQNRKNSSDEI